MTETMTRVIYDMPDATYRKAEGVSNSMLKQLRDRWCPALAVARLKQPKVAGDAMLFGKALHEQVLTPDLPTTVVVGAEELTFRSKAGVAWRDNMLALGKTPITAPQSVRLERTVAALRGHALASEVFRSGKAEVSVFAPYSLGGVVLRKARMDFVTAGAAIVDLKSAADCSPKCVGKRDEFSSQLFDLDYDMQAAFYLDLWNEAAPAERKEAFVFVAVDWDEDTQFVGVRVLQCDETVIRSGRDKYTEALAKWIECHQSGRWPGYPEEVTMLSVPDFVARKYRTI